MAELLEQLERRRAGYDDEQEWHRFLLDSYTGGGGYRGRVRQPPTGWWGRAASRYSALAAFEEGVGSWPSYLDRHPREDWPKYDDRRATSHLVNVVQPVIDLKLGFLFARRPTYLGQPPALAAWREDVDGAGTTWDEMRPAVALTAALFGWAPVAVDMTPALEGESIAQASARGAARPRAIPLTPANVVDYEADGARFRWAKIRTDHADRDEWTGETITRSEYRVWTPSTVSTYEVREYGRDRGASTIALDVPHPFGEVPIAIFRHRAVQGELVKGAPMHGPIADMQRRLYNLLSEMDEHLRSQSFATLVVATDSPSIGEITIGPDNALPLAADAKQQHYYMSPGTGVGDVLERRIEATIDAIRRAACAEFTRPVALEGGRGRRTRARATEPGRRYQFDLAQRLLGDFAIEMARAEQRMDAIAWAGLGGRREELRGYRVTPPVDFGVVDLKAEIENTIRTLSIDLGDTMRKRIGLRLAGLLDPGMPPAVRARVEAEIEGR